ncbi:MAG: DUF4126 domain-containing protein [Coriobacteriales bacterium]|nr:DUF4126 domain-containing protein [Coriobacteriales bacterium]
MDLLTAITLAAPAGVNAYIPLLAVALAQAFGWIQLRQPFDVLGDWWVIAVLAVLFVIEVVADKVPAVDHANDAIQTVLRPAAGGVLAVAASGQADVNPYLLVIAGALIAGGVHSVKAAARPVVNATTGGVGAPVVSFVEDVWAAIMTVLAFVAPVLAALVIVAFGAGIFILIKRWRDSRVRV